MPRTSFRNSGYWMPRVFLVHWKEEERPERAERLEAAGYEVDYEMSAFGAFRKQIRAHPPAAIVIDLSRTPSHGREVATSLRETKWSRSIPIVFVDGEEAKVERTKQLLPDATYTKWSRIKSALRKAIANPPKDPVSPGSLAAYSGTPLTKKLGIKPGFVVALINAPNGFESTLGTLPDDVTLRASARGRNDLMIWFPKNLTDYEKRVVKVGDQFGDGLWVAWPRKTSGIPSDLNGNVVRQIGLASGLVDYKICSIDEIYSGLKFARRKT